MRTLLSAIAVAVLTLVLGTTVIVAKLLRIPNRRGGIYDRCMSTWARGLIRAAGVTLRVHGGEHISRDRGVVYVANHVSWYDVFALAAIIERFSFVAKLELRKIPIFGFAAEAAGVVFLDRDNRKSAFTAYESAAGEVRAGRSIVVCPEGTRGRDYHLRPFKKGPFVLAIAAQADIVPVVSHGQREVMRKGSFWVRSGEIDVHFLPAVPTAGLGYEDRGPLMEKVWQSMADCLEREYGEHTREHAIAQQGERVS